MALPRQQKAASGIQFKYKLDKVFDRIFDHDNPVYNYGGFYDINLDQGALSIAGNEPQQNGDPIHTLKQHVQGASGSDIVFTDMNDETIKREQAWRKHVQWETGTETTTKPVCFYPEGYFDDLFIKDSNDEWVQNPDAELELNVAQGTFNVPSSAIIEEYTIALAGARTLHMLGPSTSDLEAMIGSSADAGSFLGVPVPPEPGVFVIRVKIDPNTRMPQVQTYSNGELVDVEAETGSDPGANMGEVPEGDSLDLDQFINFLSMPCWGTQKLLVISRALTEKEIKQITGRMNRTMRVRTV